MPIEAAPTHRLGHVTDSHFSVSGVLHDVTTRATFVAALEALEATGLQLDALVHTGDITDDGAGVAYAAVREAAASVTGRTGWPVVWVAGNHDVRAPMREHLLGEPASDAPVDQVHDIRGLRVVNLDTSIPRRVEGGLDPEQLDRLRDVLAEPAEHGTVLVLHHPPVPVEVTVMQALHLTGQDALAAVLQGTDVRAVLGGHLHYATASTFAGVPVFVAPSTAYTIRLVAPGGGIVGADGGRAAGVLSLYADGRVGYTAVPADGAPVVARAAEEEFAGLGVNAPH